MVTFVENSPYFCGWSVLHDNNDDENDRNDNNDNDDEDKDKDNHYDDNDTDNDCSGPLVLSLSRG